MSYSKIFNINTPASTTEIIISGLTAEKTDFANADCANADCANEKSRQEKIKFFMAPFQKIAGPGRIIYIFDKLFLEKFFHLCNDIDSAAVSNNSPGLLLSGGEDVKSLKTLKRIYAFLIKNRVDKNDLILIFGGGSVCDIGAFAASTFKRGVPFCLVPTTLLAQIDAALGGKTAINFFSLKNMAGTIAQAQTIYIEPAFISSLDNIQILNAKGEICKYWLLGVKNTLAFLKDPDIYEKINSLDRDFYASRVIPLIKSCVNFKMKIVQKDPLDKKKRRILNLGHTLGHGLEKFYSSFGAAGAAQKMQLHGICVAQGLDFVLYISFNMGLITEIQYNKIKKQLHLFRVRGFIFNAFPLKQINRNYINKIFEYIAHDKKQSSCKIDMILINNKGPVIKNIPLKSLLLYLKAYFKITKTAVNPVFCPSLSAHKNLDSSIKKIPALLNSGLVKYIEIRIDTFERTDNSSVNNGSLNQFLHLFSRFSGLCACFKLKDHKCPDNIKVWLDIMMMSVKAGALAVDIDIDMPESALAVFYDFLHNHEASFPDKKIVLILSKHFSLKELSQKENSLKENLSDGHSSDMHSSDIYSLDRQSFELIRNYILKALEKRAHIIKIITPESVQLSESAVKEVYQLFCTLTSSGSIPGQARPLKLIFFGLGEANAFTRLLSLKYNAPFTFTAFPGLKATAPGQPELADIAVDLFLKGYFQ
jgi:3-dehydroquinate synthase